MSVTVGMSHSGHYRHSNVNQADLEQILDDMERNDEYGRQSVVTETPFDDNDDDDIDNMQEIVSLNIGGVRHDVGLNTLLRFPQSRLGKMASKYKKLDSDKPIFYDRHPLVFLTVLDFYRTGELHYPMTVCGSVVKRELEFWGIPFGKMQACCVTNFSAYVTSSRILVDTSKTVTDDLLRKSKSAKSSWKRFQYKTTYLFENPTSSVGALILAVISSMAVLLSIVTLCLASMEQFQFKTTNITAICPEKTLVSGDEGHSTNLAEDSILRYIDTGCAIFFSIELFVRFIAAPNKRRFLLNVLTIIEILALVPSYVHIMLHILGVKIFCKSQRMIEFVHAVSILRMLRVFRAFHLLRHYGPFHLLTYTLHNTVNVIFMLSVFVIIAVLVLGNLIYFIEMPRTITVEGENPSQIRNIPQGFWWAIVTMTTLGYGDKIPSSVIGYCVGGLASIIGVILISFIVPILSNTFNLAYNFQLASDIVYSNDSPIDRNVIGEWGKCCGMGCVKGSSDDDKQFNINGLNQHHPLDDELIEGLMNVEPETSV